MPITLGKAVFAYRVGLSPDESRLRNRIAKDRV